VLLSEEVARAQGSDAASAPTKEKKQSNGGAAALLFSCCAKEEAQRIAESQNRSASSCAAAEQRVEAKQILFSLALFLSLPRLFRLGCRKFRFRAFSVWSFRMGFGK
jgi:hypothetical protein